jgi:hypothetical protein
MTFAKCDGHDLAVTLSSDLRAWRDEIALALLGCGHRVPEVAVAKCRVLRIGQGRQTRQVLDQPGGRFGTGRVARPRIVARSVRITGPGKIGPGVDKLIGQYRLLAVQRMGNAQWSAMPEREQVLDIVASSMTCWWHWTRSSARSMWPAGGRGSRRSACCRRDRSDRRCPGCRTAE